MLEVQNSDHLALVDERDRQLRSRLRVLGDIARILADIRRENRLSLLRRTSDDASAQGHVALPCHALAIAARKAVLGLPGAVGPEENNEHLEVDPPLQHEPDTPQRGVEVTAAGELP